MPTSGSYDYTVNRDVLIKDALLDIGAVSDTNTVPSGVNEHAQRKLNLLLKALQAKGLRMWKARHVTLLLQKAQGSYRLGPTGDHLCLNSDFVETTIRVAAIASATVLEVVSTAGMLGGDFIGVQLDSGSMHFTTINSITDADTLVLTTGLASAAAVSQVVYSYTTKAQRPLEIVEAWTRTKENFDSPVNIISREEYARYGDKVTAGTINNIFYDKQLASGVLYVWQPESTVSDTLEMWVQYPMEDVDSATDNFDCPEEWLLAIQLNLELALCPRYGIQGAQLKTIAQLADMYLEDAMGFDKETTSIYITPGND